MFNHIYIFLFNIANGALAGLVGITGSAAVVEPWAAVIIGITSGWIYLAGTNFFTKIMRVSKKTSLKHKLVYQKKTIYIPLPKQSICIYHSDSSLN